MTRGDDPEPVVKREKRVLREGEEAPLPKPSLDPKETARAKKHEAKDKDPRDGRLLDPSLQGLDALDCDSLVLSLTTDGRPLTGVAGAVDWRLCGALSKLLLGGVLTGVAGEKALFPTQGRLKPVRIFLFGWGPRIRLEQGAGERLRFIVETLQLAKVQRVAIALPEPARGLLGLVETHLEKPLGASLVGVFAPDAADSVEAA